MHRVWVVLIAGAMLVPGSAYARRSRKNDLLRVITPAERATVPAHPFVNVIVRFGRTKGGLPADPATFRARLGRNELAASFTDIVENDVVVGKRAALEPPLIHEGRAVNRLRLEVRTIPLRTRKGRPGRRLRDIDRLRFRAIHADDHAPVARISASTDFFLPGVPVQFSAAQSFDVDDDALVAHWDFGDGATSDDWTPSHVFGLADSLSGAFVTLSVSDRDLAGTDQRQLEAIPPLCAGCTPGHLSVSSTQPLEFGPVAPGASRTLTFTVSNPDTAPTSQLHTRVATGAASFIAAPADFSLGPRASQSVTVTFAPATTGHQSANLTLVASAANRPILHLLAHGFGGTAPGTGPTLAADPLFNADLFGSTSGILPDGTRFFADNGVHACLGPNGVGTLDLCTKDTDCVTPGETCATSSTCIGGDRQNQVCTVPADCPRGSCRSYSAAEPVDMCGDGTGGLYLITDVGTYTDPNPGDTELSTTIARLQFDPATGVRTAADIVARATEQTSQIACDGFAPSAGGQVYVPQFFSVARPATLCSRDEREVLTAFSKATGAPTPILPDVDAAGGYAECDDFEQALDLEVTRDASAIFVSLPATGPGLLATEVWRIRPTPLRTLVIANPNVCRTGKCSNDGAKNCTSDRDCSPSLPDTFQVHPDGSLLYALADDAGSTGALKLYKISVNQAAHGAPYLADLTPCAVYQLPNNRWSSCSGGPTPDKNCTTHADCGRGGTCMIRGQTLLGTSSVAVDRAAPGSLDGVVFVSFITTGAPDISRSLLAQGTVAIAAPADSNACTVLGLLNLEFFDPLTF